MTRQQKEKFRLVDPDFNADDGGDVVVPEVIPVDSGEPR